MPLLMPLHQQEPRIRVRAGLRRAELLHLADLAERVGREAPLVARGEGGRAAAGWSEAHELFSCLELLGIRRS